MKLNLPAKDTVIRSIWESLATINGGLAHAGPKVVALMAGGGMPVAGVCGAVGEAVGAEFEG